MDWSWIETVPGLRLRGRPASSGAHSPGRRGPEPEKGRLREPSCGSRGRRADGPWRSSSHRLAAESSPLLDARVTSALFVTEPDARADESPERLCRLYGFTSVEAEIASRILAGAHLSDISEELGISIHTVRGYLKQLFAKTGTHRQPDLVRVLLTGLPGLRLD